MAARKTLVHADKFYVYRFIDSDGQVAYIGKGSGRRFRVQQRNMDMYGEIVSYHSVEADAYKEEIRLIAEFSPYKNKHQGGNGPITKEPVKYRKTKFDILCDKIGAKAVAARICLSYSHVIDPSKIDMLRRVAYG